MDIILGFALLKMADSIYVALRDESSFSRLEMTQCQDTQSGSKSLTSLKILLGFLVCLMLLVCGFCIIVRPQTYMTHTNIELRRNLTHITQDSRLVPHNIHDMSHRQSVSHQVNVSHSQFHQNDILYNESSFNETTRNKRSLFLTLLLLGMHVKVPTTRVSH